MSRMLIRNKGADAMESNWVDGFEIKVCIENGVATISANREGLLSLANHVINCKYWMHPDNAFIGDSFPATRNEVYSR